MFSHLLSQKYANDREAKLPRYRWRTSSTVRKAAQKRSEGNLKCEMIQHKGPQKLTEELKSPFFKSALITFTVSANSNFLSKLRLAIPR